MTTATGLVSTQRPWYAPAMVAHAHFDAVELTRLKRVSSVALSPDGSWLAVAVARLVEAEGKYVSDLWRVPVSEGAAVQLTRGPGNDTSPCFRRDGALGFLSNRNPRAGAPEAGDDTRCQVWLLPADGGEPMPLTDEPLGASEFRFAAAGDRLVVVAPVVPGLPHSEQRAHVAARGTTAPTGFRYRRQPVRHWDHWVLPEAPHLISYDEHGGGRRDLTPTADRAHRPVMFEVQWDLARAGDQVVISYATPGADRLEDLALQVLDTTTGAQLAMLGVNPATQHTSPIFSPCGTKVACQRHQRSAERAGKEELWLYELGTATGIPLANDWDNWLTPQAWTPDGQGILATGPVRGCEPVVRVDAATGNTTRITSEAAGGCHGSVAVTSAGNTIVGVRHTLLHPPEPFVAELRPNTEPRLLASLSGFTAEQGASIAGWESIGVPSTDQTPIQSFVVFPTGDAAPRPAVINIHGGPLSHHCDGWHWRWNPLVWAAAGYVVACPNPRGSVGFGQKFADEIWNNRWGGQCYEDLMAVTDVVTARPEVDGSQVAAMGGSFGGYMTNWIGTQTDRFRCLISHASLYDLGAFHGATDLPPWWVLETGVSPWTQREQFEHYSPHLQVANWKTPVLITHGERDYRVPISEALALFESLQEHGVDSELLVFPDENHWILKPANARQWYEAGLEFLARHLGARS